MSAPDARTPAPSPLKRGGAAPDGGPYGSIVIVGGGCYGRYYVRQLERARARGALSWRRLVVVDRDPRCAVATEGLLATVPDLSLAVADWSGFFDDFLSAAAASPSGERDAIVPSPLMPHLMFDWLLRRAAARWPGRRVAREPLDAPPRVPWERAGADGTHYASFATWMCPVNCVEPAVCPHTRGTRDWSMPEALAAFARDAAGRGTTLAGPVVFHCTHRAYGVGMFDVADVVAADALVRRAGTGAAAKVLVGTASHCHGALAVLALGEPPTE